MIGVKLGIKLLFLKKDFGDLSNIAPTENEIIEYNASTFKEFIQKKLTQV